MRRCAALAFVATLLFGMAGASAQVSPDMAHYGRVVRGKLDAQKRKNRTRQPGIVYVSFSLMVVDS